MKEQEKMDEFERALTRALRRVEVRAETSAKFLAIAAGAEQHRRRDGRRWFRPVGGGLIHGMSLISGPQAWVGGAVAAMLVLGLFAGEQVHARHEREQTELANQEFGTAVRATDQALGQVRAQLAQAGLRLQ